MTNGEVKTETREERLTKKYADQPRLLSYLLAHPRARRTRPTAIVVSTSCRREYTCICGSGVSESAKWPQTVRVRSWRREHDARCGQ